MSIPKTLGKFPFALPPALTKWIRRELPCIGLDIGSSSVKAVKVKKETAGPTWLQHAEALFPPAAPLEERAKIVQQTLSDIGGNGSGVLTAVGGTGTILRPVEIPKMTPAELKTALNFEAEKYIPFKLEEVFLDSIILRDLPGGRMEIILAAARKELVRSHLELLSSAGVVARGLTLDAVSLANAWEAGLPEPSGDSAVLMHLGARGTVLNFMSGSTLRFTREIPLGGEAFTQAVAGGLQVDPAEAERIKCHPAERLNEVRTALQSSWEEWLTQCRASFDFYENQFGQGTSRIFLSGGSARLAGLKEWIQESINLPTQWWNPLKGLHSEQGEPPTEEAALSLGVAVGLAVTGLSG